MKMYLIIVFPIENEDIPARDVSLPEGNQFISPWKLDRISQPHCRKEGSRIIFSKNRNPFSQKMWVSGRVDWN